MKSLVIASGSQASTANTTQYWYPFGYLGVDTVEAESQTVMREGTNTMSDEYIRVTANTVNTATTIRSRNNNANGNQSVSVGGSTTGVFEDATNTDAVTTGNKFGVQSVPGTTGTFTLSAISFLQSTDTASTTATRLLDGKAYAFTTASTTRHAGYSGHFTWQTSGEANFRVIQKKAGTYKQLAIYISANAKNSTTTYGGKKNGTAGALTISITSATTGLFEDTTNSDTIAVDDGYDTFLTTGTGTFNITSEWKAISFVSTASIGIALACNNAINASAATTTYNTLTGQLLIPTTEADTKVKTRAAYTFHNLRGNITTNSITASSTLRFRKNGANGNGAISWASSTTGEFVDVTNTDICTASDDVNYQFVAGATGTTNTMRYWGCNFDVPSGSTLYQRTNTESSISVSETTPKRKISRFESESSISVSDTTPKRKITRPKTETVVLSELVPKRKISRFKAETVVISDLLSKISKFKRTATTTVLYDDMESGGLYTFTVGNTSANGKWYGESASSGGYSFGTVTDSGSNEVLYNRSDPATNGTSYIKFAQSPYNSNVSDFIIEFDVKNQSQSQGSPQSYECSWFNIKYVDTTNKIHIIFATTHIECVRRSLGSDTLLYNDSTASFPVGTWRKVRIQVIGNNRFICWVDGANIFDVTDASLPAGIAASGTTLFESVNCEARYDNINFIKPYETVSVSDAVSRIKRFIRSISESSITVSDTTPKRKITRVKSESVSVSDITPKRKIGRFLTDSTTVSDSLTRIKKTIRAISEASISVSESIKRRISRFKSESVSVSDSVKRKISRFLTGSTSISDLVVSAIVRSVIITESAISVSDSLTKIKLVIRSISEPSKSVSDSLSRKLYAFRQIAESTSISDSLTKIKRLIRSISESALSVSDTLTRKVNRALFEDQVILTGSVVRLRKVPRTMLENALSIGDTLSRFYKAIRSSVQTTTISESLTKVKRIIRSSTESTITVGDNTVIRKFGKFFVFVTEPAINIGESLTKKLFVYRTIVQTTTISESLLKTRRFIRSVIEPTIQLLQDQILVKVIVQGTGGIAAAGRHFTYRYLSFHRKKKFS